MMTLMVLRRSFIWVTVAASVCMPTAYASTENGNAQQEQPGYVMRQTTRRVLVDVVVTDGKGNPVRGLKRDDFAVKEDGKSQRILSFEAEDGSKTNFIPPKLPNLPVNTFLNLPTEPERGPLYVLLYDMVNTEVDQQMSTHNQLLNFIDTKPEGTRFAIFINASGLQMIQGFTSDRAVLRAALTSPGPGPHMPKVFLNGENYGRNSTSAMISIFNFLSQYLEGLPGRKNLIWLSGKFPVALNADPNHFQDMESQSVKEAIAAMTRSQIAIYPVDVKGVDGAGGVEGAAMSGGPGAGASADVIAKSYSSTLSGSSGAYLQMMEIGKITGGRGFTGNNHLSELIEKAVEHGETYYTLSYSPTNEKYDYSARHIQVNLAPKGYQLSYRQVYFALPERGADSNDDGSKVPKKKKDTPDTRFTAAKEADNLYANIEHGAPMIHDLLFSAHVGVSGTAAMATAAQMSELQDQPAYFKTRRKDQAPKPLSPVKLQTYRIHYLVLDPQLKATAERTGKPAALEFAAVAYDASGRMLNGISNEATATEPKGADGKHEVKFRIDQELNVPAGAAWIRMAVRDKLTGRTGTLEVALPLKAEPVAEAENLVPAASK